MGFNPTFYWTGNLETDAQLINKPHIEAEGVKENRIKETIEIMNMCRGVEIFFLKDALNIQNELLKKNNWRGIEPGIRNHNVVIKKSNDEFEQPPNYTVAKEMAARLFPVNMQGKYALLEWYRKIQIVHPLSDLNGRVFGIIVAVLYNSYLKTRTENR